MTLLNVSSDDTLLTIAFMHEKIHDSEMIEPMQAELLAALAEADGRNVLLDFRPVNFFSSAALGMLMRAYKRCKESETDLRLCSLSPNLRVVFKVSGLDRIFHIHENADEAKLAMSGGTPTPEAARPAAKTTKTARKS